MRNHLLLLAALIALWSLSGCATHSVKNQLDYERSVYATGETPRASLTPLLYLAAIPFDIVTAPIQLVFAWSMLDAMQR